ncbi:lambda-exonuclease family protein [uncultured Tolumonas sp.]|uniref:YqaJ viral recombinase family nuclease n=1 Tax=uncultured Tolumonas sp. TaxID=263765 RepID=UPI00292EA1C4|nr:YqaJ viral recombinase family protein [uncultured Tolumonas sp.]
MKTRYNQAIRLASTTQLSREEWLQIRSTGIGSSDAAAAIGLSSYKCSLSLWLEKTGRQLPEDLSEKEAVVWGTVMEPVLAKMYAERTGRKVRRVNAVLQHPEHPFMLANLDREVITEHGTGVLEIKTAGFYSAQLWDDGVPVAYQCQVLHQLAVTGHAWADVAVLIAGQEFRIYRIERDDDKIADLIQREAQFWSWVTNNQQPDPDGSYDAQQALLSLFPTDNGQTLDFSESGPFNDLFAELLILRHRKEEIEEQESTLKHRIQAALGSATAAIFQQGKVTWRKAKDRLVPDLDRLSLEHPELLQQYAKAVPGARRFIIQPARSSS